MILKWLSVRQLHDPWKNALLVNDIKPLSLWPFQKPRTAESPKRRGVPMTRLRTNWGENLAHFVLDKSIFSTTRDNIIIFMSSLNLRQTSLLDYTKNRSQNEYHTLFLFPPVFPSCSRDVSWNSLLSCVVDCCRIGPSIVSGVLVKRYV